MQSATVDAAEWLESLHSATLAECGASKRQVEEKWRQPLGERLASGHAMGLLRVIKKEGPRIVLELSSPDLHPCFLREGDFVRLSRNDPFQPLAWLVLMGEDFEGIHAFIWKGGAPAPGEDELTVDRDHIDLTDRYLDALSALARSPRIMEMLMGGTKPETDLDLDASCRDELEGSSYNPSQVDAIASCIAAKDAFLVQGPPGTGKTRVLAEVASRLLARGESLLITGPTHRAIDHALSAIRKCAEPEVRVVKIGFAGLGLPADFERFEHYAESGLAEHAEPHVVGATPFALWKKDTGLYTARFDTVLLDEASQIVPLQAAMSMMRGERWLFFGDDQQLPPVILTAGNTPIKSRSVFGLLRNRDMEVMLEESYRLSEDLAAWPSASFYGNRLKGRHQRQLHLGGGADSPLLPAPSLAIERLDSEGCSVRNEDEAERVRELVVRLVNGGVRPEDIGIVTPFRAQAALIRRLVKLALPDRGWREITVDTVERFQGQEREVMLVAMTASEPLFIERLADFLFQAERLNVAVTRARVKTVVLVPDQLAERANRLADQGHEGANVFCSLLNECSI